MAPSIVLRDTLPSEISLETIQGMADLFHTAEDAEGWVHAILDAQEVRGISTSLQRMSFSDMATLPEGFSWVVFVTSPQSRKVVSLMALLIERFMRCNCKVANSMEEAELFLLERDGNLEF